MKNYMFIIAISAVFALSACGSGSSTSSTNDSTAVVMDSVGAQVDTSAVSANDTTVAEISSGKEETK